MPFNALSPLHNHPRTKQEIEADYQRRKIVKKFRKRIQKFENSDMDAEMDLKKGKDAMGRSNASAERRIFL